MFKEIGGRLQFAGGDKLFRSAERMPSRVDFPGSRRPVVDLAARKYRYPLAPCDLGRTRWLVTFWRFAPVS